MVHDPRGPDPDAPRGTVMREPRPEIHAVAQPWIRFVENMLALLFAVPFFYALPFVVLWNLWVRESSASISVPTDTILALTEYAKKGNRTDFVWLARASGISERDIEPLWAGVRSRLGFEEVKTSQVSTPGVPRR